MRHIVAGLLVAAALLSANGAQAQAFTPVESAEFARGEIVQRPQALRLRSGRYVGGFVYAILNTSPDELSSLLENVATYRRILPYTKDVRFIGRHRVGDSLVWLRQGNALLDASYTVGVHAGLAQRAGQRLVRFRVDPSLPHGIHDASGFFEFEPLANTPSGEPRVLVTYGIWVDIGSGIVRDLFEGRIQRIALTVPQRLRDYVAERARTAASLPSK
jgi:hypothetical protein